MTKGAKTRTVTLRLADDTNNTLEQMATSAAITRAEAGGLALQLGLQELASYPGGVSALLENQARAAMLQEVFGSNVASRLERIAKDQDLSSLEVARIALGIGCDGLENRGSRDDRSV